MANTEQSRKSQKAIIPSWFNSKLQNNPIIGKDLAIAECSICQIEVERKYIEFKRSCYSQSEYVNEFHCKSCLFKSKNYKNKINNSKYDENWRKDCSKRSKSYWESLSKDDREKLIEKSIAWKYDENVRSKISKKVKEKFNDQEYVNKIKKARKKYWTDKKYRNNRIISVDDFIYRAKLLHGNKYDYSLVKFDGPAKKIKVDIICKKHGIFKQRPLWHIIYGNGCPSCKSLISKPHKEIIDYIKSLYGGEIIINDRKQIGLELDLYIPDKKFAIEFHGNWYHSHNTINDFKYLHYNKSLKCNKKNISLFQIFEYDWNIDIKKKIIKSMISNKLGISNRIYARKCKFKNISNKQYKEFIDTNHLYGCKYATVKYGLYYDDELVIVMSFQKNKDDWEICRLATKINTIVVGGASKIFKRFINDFNPKYVYTYADKCLSNGDVYYNMGFKLHSITKPGYKYFKNNIVYSRIKFQKHKLHSILPKYDDKLTEFENMFNNGYKIIWDAGNNKYEYCLSTFKE